MVLPTKEYLGDGVYIEIENGMIKLTTNNGIKDTNTIYLEYAVYESFLDYIKKFIKAKSENA